MQENEMYMRGVKGQDFPKILHSENPDLHDSKCVYSTP